MKTNSLSYLFFLILVGCTANNTCEICDEELATTKEPSAIIIDVKEMDVLSSGSGMVFHNGAFYAVGDDDPFLWKLDLNGNVLNKWTIWDTSSVKQNRIPKKIKPDFEAMSLYNNKNGSKLLIFGSGSKPKKRDLILQFDLTTETMLEDTPSALSFFHFLRMSVFSKPTLNMEGATFWDDQLLLLNRSTNSLLNIPTTHFFEMLQQDSISTINYDMYHYTLPVLGGDTARFSGASVIPQTNYLLFSASIEQTKDWVEDGGILGSFIGLINLKHLDKPPIICELVKWEDGSTFLGKIEGVHGTLNNDGTISVTAITDNDDGKTNWLKINLKR